MEREIVKVYADTIDPDHSPTLWEPEYHNVLDHGHIGLVDFMGDDSAVINAARCSYGKGTKATSSDEGLIRYLMRHWHTTPFEMCDFKFHVKAPIFVFRQWHRHRTASINEYSGRYSILDNEMYVPSYDHTAAQAVDNKQGRMNGLLIPEDYEAVKEVLEYINETTYSAYMHLNGPDEDGNQPNAPDEIEKRRKTIEAGAMATIQKLRREQLAKPEDERLDYTEADVESILRDWFIQADSHQITDEFPGIARELSRMVLPVATYSQMYWKANLHNIMHFLRLRADSHAQYEIRIYAEKMIELIEPYAPMSMKAFEDYRLNASTLSAMETKLLRAARTGAIDISNDGAVEQFLKNEGCGAREVREFLTK